jgi:alkylated DNA repair dioxygenase AlkB
MSDLFGTTDTASTFIELPDATLTFFRHALPDVEASAYFEALHTSIEWREERIFVWGKWHKQPRLIAWYGDPAATYSYSGSKLDPLPWTTALSELRSRVEQLSRAAFNSVLLNLYRNQHDHMGWHSDDEKSLGATPVIASLTLGGTRTFQMKHKKRRELGIKSLDLTSGSLLIMSGLTQKFWLHGIKEESKPTEPRINLTFRQILKTL